ncbi:MAG: PD40 domain-containing protein [Alphaproteobacteria bacterium]|nr:PD40 domain-containing protein [Alphaproteobacteria bacterium]
MTNQFVKWGLLATLSVTAFAPVVAQESSGEKPLAFNMPDGITADSKRITFQSWERVTEDRNTAQHFSVDVETGEIRREGQMGRWIGWPSFTKDGKRVVFHTRISGNAELVVADLAVPNDMNEFLTVKRLTVGEKYDFFASWSPDETEITFYGGRTGAPQIFVMKADGSNVRNLSNNNVHESDPTWSSKGEITFESHVAGNPDVWVMNGDGSGRRNLTNHPADDRFGAWSPDGEQIVFSSDRDGDQDIYVMNRDGTGVRQLTNADGTDHWPRWAPDGSFITWVRETDDSAQVFMMKPDGTGERRLTNNRSYHEK